VEKVFLLSAEKSFLNTRREFVKLKTEAFVFAQNVTINDTTELSELSNAISIYHANVNE